MKSWFIKFGSYIMKTLLSSLSADGGLEVVAYDYQLEL